MHDPFLSTQEIFDAQYRRVFEAAGCRTQVELAGFFDVTQSSISDAKRRRSIPSDWLVRLLVKKRTSPEWILFGKGSKHLVPTDTEQGKPLVLRIVEIRPPQECSTEELVNELVRRSLRELNFAALQPGIAEGCVPGSTLEGEV